MQVSLSAFAYLFSEMVQYSQTRVNNVAELERKSVRVPGWWLEMVKNVALTSPAHGNSLIPSLFTYENVDRLMRVPFLSPLQAGGPRLQCWLEDA